MAWLFFFEQQEYCVRKPQLVHMPERCVSNQWRTCLHPHRSAVNKVALPIRLQTRLVPYNFSTIKAPLLFRSFKSFYYEAALQETSRFHRQSLSIYIWGQLADGFVRSDLQIPSRSYTDNRGRVPTVPKEQFGVHYYLLSYGHVACNMTPNIE